MTIPTVQELNDLNEDMTDFAEIVNGGVNTEVTTRYGGVIPSVQKAVLAAADGQIRGVRVFETYAELDAFTPTVGQQTLSFKVTKDTADPSRNGFYSWVSGTTYRKDADLVVNVIDANNTYDAVSGAAVDVYVENNTIVRISEMNRAGMRNYTGDDVYPVVSDSTGKVLLGYDPSTSELIGAFPAQSYSAAKNSTQLDASQVIKHKALNQFLSYGQSLSIGQEGKPALSLTQPYSNVTFVGGVKLTTQDYSSTIPLVEDDNNSSSGSASVGETICSGAANYSTSLAVKENGLIPSNHVILASAVGYGGYSITQLEKGTTWYASDFLPAIQGAHNLNSDHALQAVSWMQGEADYAMNYATYKTKLVQLANDIDADAKVITNQSHPVHFLTYQTSRNSAGQPDRVKAQFDAARENKNIHLVSPMYFFTYGDGVHLTNEGYKWYGAYVGRAYKQLAHDNLNPEFLNPVSAYLEGNILTLQFDVPTLPLVFDNSLTGAVNQNGFRVTNNGSSVNQTSRVIDGDKLVITLQTAPTGDVRVRCGLDYAGASTTADTCGTADLRDSTSDTITINSSVKTLYHWVPQFELEVIKIGE
jgi:hypothetical protein